MIEAAIRVRISDLQNTKFQKNVLPRNLLLNLAQLIFVRDMCAYLSSFSSWRHSVLLLSRQGISTSISRQHVGLWHLSIYYSTNNEYCTVRSVANERWERPSLASTSFHIQTLRTAGSVHTFLHPQTSCVSSRLLFTSHRKSEPQSYLASCRLGRSTSPTT